MNDQTKDFHIGDILSITTGRLVSPRHIEGVYDILGWMSGESLFTHQLPRVGREAAPVILKTHPQLADAQQEADHVTKDNWEHFLTKMVERYGERLPIPKLSADEHERIDPMSELAEKVHPSKIIPISVA